MRFEVPQFIEVEDKIIGPLTWRQFVYLAGGGGILITLFLYAPFIIFALIGIPLGILAAALAFHRINNRPFISFLESVVDYFTGTKLYLWQKEKQETVVYDTSPEIPPPNTLGFTHKSSLSSLANKLENHIQD